MAGIQPFAVTVGDLCFCHWPVEADALARSVPDWLTVDTAAGSAWLTAVPATVTAIAAFGVDLTRPAETVTIRTPVRGPDDQRGLYHFAVVSDSTLAAATATPLPHLSLRRGQHSRTAVDSGDTRRRVHVDGQQLLTVTYRDTAEPTPAPPDSLASFLLERRRYFTPGPLGSRLCGNVGREPWPLAPVGADVSAALSSALAVPDPIGDPVCQYSPGTELHVDPPRPTWLD